MSLINQVQRFARGPQGRKLTAKAKRFAREPSTKKRVEQVRRRFARR
jgi:hypothetical protein